MAKIALLIGVSEYEPGLNRLPGAVRDVDAMQRVLQNPAIGGFAASDVKVLKNPERQAMDEAIFALFDDRQKDDLVLLYFSGHGITDDTGEFYLGTRHTRKQQGRLITPSAVAARDVHRQMDRTRSRRLVIILDCCFGAAFAKGVTAKDSGSVNIQASLGGEGRAILTAANSVDYAFEQEGLELSIYTHYLVEGLEKGAADQDDDGWISADELHDYVSSRVKEAAPAMSPGFFPVRDGYKILLAKSPKDDPKLRYRKQVKLLAEEDEGDFSFINRSYLEDLQRSLVLSPDDATAIETEELEPYRQRRAKVDRYRTVFEGAIDKRYPLTERDRLGLQRFQQLLSLRDEDVTAIEAPLLAPKRAAYEQQQAALKQQQREQEQQTEQRQQEQERLAREQAEQRRQATPTSRQSPTARADLGVQTQPFEFETATLAIVKKPGLFGGKTTVEISRSRGRATHFAEDLGNGVTLDMVAISGGEFLMGTSVSQREAILQEYLKTASKKDAEKWVSWELPQHKVVVPAFCMGKYPVTQAQYEAIVGTNPASFKGAKRPVEQVSWDDAIAFCTQLSQKSGKLYRLPTEAEWEYACRAGTTTPFYVGETITPDLANYDGNYAYGEGAKGTCRQQTIDVGSFPANPFGLYDMHGNVWEWCADQWYGSYANKPEALKQNGAIAWTEETTGIAPKADETEIRLLRGGSWYLNPWYCRSANRTWSWRDIRDLNVGFRLVCAVPSTL